MHSMKKSLGKPDAIIEQVSLFHLETMQQHVVMALEGQTLQQLSFGADIKLFGDISSH